MTNMQRLPRRLKPASHKHERQHLTPRYGAQHSHRKFFTTVRLSKQNYHYWYLPQLQGMYLIQKNSGAKLHRSLLQ